MSLAFLSGMYGRTETVGEKPEVKGSYAVTSNGKHVFLPKYGSSFSRVEVTVAVEDGDVKPSEGLGYTEAENLYCSLYNRGECDDDVIVVPSVDPQNGLPVVGLHNFSDNQMTGLILPDTITKLGAAAILTAPNLKYIKFGRYFRECGSSQYANALTATPTDVVLDFSNYARDEVPVLRDASLLTGVIEVWVPLNMFNKWKTDTKWLSVQDKIFGV